MMLALVVMIPFTFQTIIFIPLDLLDLRSVSHAPEFGYGNRKISLKFKKVRRSEKIRRECFHATQSDDRNMGLAFAPGLPNCRLHCGLSRNLLDDLPSSPRGLHLQHVRCIDLLCSAVGRVASRRAPCISTTTAIRGSWHSHPAIRCRNRVCFIEHCMGTAYLLQVTIKLF